MSNVVAVGFDRDACMNDKQFEELSDKLNAVAKLMAIQALASCDTIIDRVRTLSEAGFQTGEIAWLLGKDSQDISKMVYKLGKKGAKTILKK